MEINKLTDAYWSQRYKNKETAWDLGSASPPLRSYFEQLSERNLKILIPGAGNAWEAEYLHQSGFTHVNILDWARDPLDAFAGRNPEFPSEGLIQADFFEHEGSYDLIMEQTFFCALDPGLRPAYGKKTHELLQSGGKIVGLLFDFELTDQGPPFGGQIEDYRKLFEADFEIRKMERCYNSIPPRQGKELFIELIKK